LKEEFTVTTTGSLSVVSLGDLGIELTHPESRDLLLEFSSDEVAQSDDVASAILSGYITAVDSSGNSISRPNEALNEALPVVDTRPLAHDPVDNTKQARLDVGSVSTGTINMPDQDVTLDSAGDARPPTPHSSTHENGGADEISVSGLSGVLADPQTPALHSSTHASGGTDPVNHDTLTNFVANEHMDQSAVCITGGEGLSGGGDITTSRALDLDVNGLPVDTVFDYATDFMVVYDTSAGAHRKSLIENLFGSLVINTFEASATGAISTSSLTDVIVPSMTLTPGAGTYLVMFSMQASHNKGGQSAFATIYANGSPVAYTEREVGGQSNNKGNCASQAVVTVGAGQAIEVYWRASSNAGGGQASSPGPRVLTLLKVG
jgi:hypothetical protein